MSASAPGADERWETSPDFVRDPLVSALVFVYGAERFMRGLFEDLEAQTFADRMEIVVVDTGSPTDEAGITREAMLRHPNVTYLRIDERETTSAACNRAVARARGKYLTIANADDRHRTDFVERMALALERNPDCILAYADSAVTRVENERFGTDRLIGHFHWPEFDARSLFECCFVGPQPFYRRELHERYGLYEPRYVTASDYELWLRVIAAGERFVHVPEVLGLYLLSPGGNENANRGLSAAESEKARLIHWPLEWGPRPEPGGSYFFPLGTAPVRSAAARGEAAAAPAQPSGQLASARPDRPSEAATAEALRRAAALVGQATAPKRAAVDAGLAARVARLGGPAAAAPAAGDSEASPAAPSAPPAGGPPSASSATPRPSGAAAGDASPSLAGADAARGADRPLVSIIVPTRDRPVWLKRALESVLRQTYAPIEIVVVNDGGADVGPLLASLDHRAQIVSIRLPQSRDRAAARNAGLALARGTYVGYLDDDDWYDPDHVATLVATLEDTGGAVAYSFARRVTEHCQGDTYVPTLIEEPFQRPFDPAVLLVTNYIPILCLMHRRDCLDDVGAFDESLGTHEDWDLFIRLARLHPFHQVERVTCAYSWRRDGSSTSSRRGDDFKRTLKLIHDRTAADAAKVPGLVAARERYLRDYAPELAGAPTCSVVLPVGNGVAATRECLLALSRAAGETTFELIAVDDATDDGTAELLAQVGGEIVVLRNEEPVGRTAALNQGAARARGRHLVFLASEVLAEPGWLDALATEADLHPEASAVGAVHLDPSGCVRSAGLAVARDGGITPLFAGVPADLPAARRPRELQILPDTGLLVRREAFIAAGGFDETLAAPLAAADLCLRLGVAGGKVRVQPASALVVGDRAIAPREATAAVRPPGAAPSCARGGAEAGPPVRAELPGRWRDTARRDLDALLLAEGFAARTRDLDGARAVHTVALDGDRERARWQRLVDLQRRIAAEGPGAARPALEEVHAYPEDPAALAWLASLCEHIDAPEWAEAYWSRLLACEDHLPAHRALARAALERGDLDGAEEHLDACAQRAPRDPEAAMIRGVLALQRERWLDARGAFTAALEAGADRAKAQRGLGMAALGQAQPEHAWALFDEAAAARPDDAEAIHWLLRAGCALERWDALVTRLERYLERRPDDAAVRFALAGVELRRDNPAAARAQHDRLRSIAPDFDGLEDLRSALDARRGAVEDGAPAGGRTGTSDPSARAGVDAA